MSIAFTTTTRYNETTSDISVIRVEVQNPKNVKPSALSVKKRSTSLNFWKGILVCNKTLEKYSEGV